jgi:hypothetical protein
MPTPTTAVGKTGVVTCTNTGIGEITSVSIHNDQGGTGWLPPGTYRVRVTRAWHDYETGDQAVGSLLDQADMETSRTAATTGFPPRSRWTPDVMFSLDDFTEDHPAVPRLMERAVELHQQVEHHRREAPDGYDFEARRWQLEGLVEALAIVTGRAPEEVRIDVLAKAAEARETS